MRHTPCGCIGPCRHCRTSSVGRGPLTPPRIPYRLPFHAARAVADRPCAVTMSDRQSVFRDQWSVKVCLRHELKFRAKGAKTTLPSWPEAMTASLTQGSPWLVRSFKTSLVRGSQGTVCALRLPCAKGAGARSASEGLRSGAKRKNSGHRPPIAGIPILLRPYNNSLLRENSFV